MLVKLWLSPRIEPQAAVGGSPGNSCRTGSVSDWPLDWPGRAGKIQEGHTPGGNSGKGMEVVHQLGTGQRSAVPFFWVYGSAVAVACFRIQTVVGYSSGDNFVLESHPWAVTAGLGIASQYNSQIHAPARIRAGGDGRPPCPDAVPLSHSPDTGIPE